MNQERLFRLLGEQDKETLLALLQQAYAFLDEDDRHSVFGEYGQQIPPTPVDGERLLVDIEQFVAVSRGGYYYEPFMIDSKNFMEVLAETEEWFEKMGELLRDSCQLTAQEMYQQAVACFGMLYEVLEEMENGEEIVFGDEIGSWMIPGDEKQYLTAYMTALAHIATTDAFVGVVIPLARRDSWNSLVGEVYTTACRLANTAQREKLDEEIRRLNIRTERWW